MVKIVEVQINDPTPSARGISVHMRRILWGMVETVVWKSDLQETDHFKESVEVEGEDRTREIKRMKKVNNDEEENFFFEAGENSRLQLEIQMNDFLQGVTTDGHEPYDNCDNQLPLSFGSASHSSKGNTKKKKKQQLTKKPACMAPDLSFKCPTGYVWNITLPTPPSTFMEDNIYHVGFLLHSLSQGDNLLPNPPLDSGLLFRFRPVRIVGCGPSSCGIQSTSATSRTTKTTVETVIVDFITADKEGEERVEVERGRLVPLEEGDVGIMKAAVTRLLHRSEPIDPSYKDLHEKYWDQRYRLFSLFDRGVVMDDESWYSVTPECIAQQIASKCYEGVNKLHRKKNKELKNIKPVKVGLMWDLFCGCGGNAIPLAAVCDSVLAVDINPSKATEARTNARIYGVESTITFKTDDAYAVLSAYIATDGQNRPKVDAILLAPPWGGTDYTKKTHFDMSTDFPSGDGLFLIKEASKVSKNIVCVFPRNVNKKQVHDLAGEMKSRCRIEEIYLYRKHKMSIIYFGSMFEK